MPVIPTQPSGPDTIDLQFVTTSAFVITGVPAASSYFWELTPQSAGTISGTGVTGTVDWNPNFLGLAHIRVKAINGCGESGWSDEKQTMVDNTTAIGEPVTAGTFLAYPNPNHGIFSISFTSDPGEEMQITVYNMQGTAVYTNPATGPGGPSEMTIDLTARPAGIYLVALQGKKILMIRKVLVK
jgi:hypothetical protein